MACSLAARGRLTAVGLAVTALAGVVAAPDLLEKTRLVTEFTGRRLAILVVLTAVATTTSVIVAYRGDPGFARDASVVVMIVAAVAATASVGLYSVSNSHRSKAGLQAKDPLRLIALQRRVFVRSDRTFALLLFIVGTWLQFFALDR